MQIDETLKQDSKIHEYGGAERMGPGKIKVRRLPLLPLRGLLVYPSMVLHLDVGGKSRLKHWSERWWMTA